MTAWWNKAAAALLAALMVLGTGLTALANENGSNPAAPATRAGQRARPEVSPEQQGAAESLRNLHQDIAKVREKIQAERADLAGKMQTIRELVRELRQDPDKNENALEKARAALRELHAILKAIHELNGQIQAKVAELRAAMEARDFPAAVRAASQLLGLLQSKLDLLKGANQTATQVIAHLKGAGQGQ